VFKVQSSGGTVGALKANDNASSSRSEIFLIQTLVAAAVLLALLPLPSANTDEL